LIQISHLSRRHLSILSGRTNTEEKIGGKKKFADQCCTPNVAGYCVMTCKSNALSHGSEESSEFIPTAAD